MFWKIEKNLGRIFVYIFEETSEKNQEVIESLTEYLYFSIHGKNLRIILGRNLEIISEMLLSKPL